MGEECHAETRRLRRCLLKRLLKRAKVIEQDSGL